MSEEMDHDEGEQPEGRSELTTLLDMLCTLESEHQRSQVIRDMPEGHECNLSFEVVEVRKEIPSGRGGEACRGGCLVIAKICDTRDEEEVDFVKIHSGQEVEILVPRQLASRARRWEAEECLYGVVSLQDWDVAKDRYQLRLSKISGMPRWAELLLIGFLLATFGPIGLMARFTWWFVGIGVVTGIAGALDLLGPDHDIVYLLAGMVFIAGVGGLLFRLVLWLDGRQNENEEESGEEDEQGSDY